MSSLLSATSSPKPETVVSGSSSGGDNVDDSIKVFVGPVECVPVTGVLGAIVCLALLDLMFTTLAAGGTNLGFGGVSTKLLLLGSCKSVILLLAKVNPSGATS